MIMSTPDLPNITVQSIRQAGTGSCIDDEIILVEHLEESDLPTVPKRMGCLFLGLCVDGRVEYSVDTITQTVQAGDIIIIGAGQVVELKAIAPQTHAMCIALSEPFFQSVLSGVHELSTLFTFSRTHPVLTLSEANKQNIMGYLSIIKAKMEDVEHRFRRDTVRSLIQSLIYDTADTIWHLQQRETAVSTRSEKIFMDFIRLVERHFRQERRVLWYAKELSITPKYLSETVKQASRQSPNEWIDSYVIIELRHLLKNSTKSIKEITIAMHFPNQSFLGKYFKEHVGMSPSAFRKNQ